LGEFKIKRLKKFVVIAKIYFHTKKISPLDEQHICQSENDFDFGGE